MGTLGRVLGNSGAKHKIEETITDKETGKKSVRTYEFGLIDQVVKDDFEKFLFEREKKALGTIKDLLTKEEFDARLQKLVEMYHSDEFAFLGKRAIEAIKKSSGAQLKLISLLTNCTTEQVVELIINHIDEVIEMLKLIIVESFPGVSVDFDAKEDAKADEPDKGPKITPVVTDAPEEEPVPKA